MRKGFEAKSFRGVPVDVDENVPKGMIYLLNERSIGFYTVDARTRLQRIKDWFKRLFKR